VAGREALFADACVNGHLVEALALRGWDVVRAIDVYPERTPDPVVFGHAAREGRVFVTNDEGILKAAADWIEQSRSFRMIYWPQEDYRVWTIGELVQAFEDLAEQADPFRYPIFRLKPRR
jgi:hypothetical protein